ncbi:DUF1389 domain-containing protein [Chlamydia gallinacea]|uniref:DUF1389 domain-containing protein n=1 Tax=Chlamydia gallinacea TaxID=1457153 RepID=UPI001C83E9CB|nr:DUF1389 domain-containing protein [Chlamydia gallinacea]MBX6687190.1 DUF1389 domain-containing protein [Chlamydia gallinacea]
MNKIVPTLLQSSCCVKYLMLNGEEKKQFLARVQVLAGIISAVFVSVLAVVMALGIVHPAIIVLASILGLIAFASLMKCAVDVCRKQIMPSPSIPSGCLQVICDNYPLVIGDLCKQERLTIQELRQVLSILGGSGDLGLENISIDLRKKLDSFGWERVVQSCEGSTLPSLDDELTRSCCLYFLKRFIDLGPKDIPISEGMAPEVYWMSPGGLCDSGAVAFSYVGWLLSNVITEEEYDLLSASARNNTWKTEEVQRIRSDIVRRCKDLAKTQNLWKEVSSSFALSHDFSFFRHGMNWEQVQLIKAMPLGMVKLFGDYENMGRIRGLGWVTLVFYFYPYLDESSPKYDPGIALITYRELVDEVVAISSGLGYHSDQNFDKIVIVIAKHSLRGNTASNPQWVYNYFWENRRAQLYNYSGFVRGNSVFSD